MKSKNAFIFRRVLDLETNFAVYRLVFSLISFPNDDELLIKIKSEWIGFSLVMLAMAKVKLRKTQ